MRILIATLGVFALAACGGGEPATTEPTADAEQSSVFELTVTDAFVMVPLEGRDITMGGATIEVAGQAARLTAAEADFAAVIELHTMSMEDGQMRMRQVEGYDLEPGTPLSLKRGGDHMMIFGVSGLEAGIQYPIRLTLELENGTTTEAEVLATARALGE